MEDFSSLESLPSLRNLNISNTKVSTLGPLLSDHIQELNLFGTMLTDYSELLSMKDLKSLVLDSMTQSLADSLTGLDLEALEFHYSKAFPLASLNVFPNLTTLFFRGDNTSTLEIGDVKLSGLTDLDLISWQIEDFSALKNLPRLTTLHIYGAVCLDYKGLDELPALKNINCTEEQKQAIMKIYPDNDFVFLV